MKKPFISNPNDQPLFQPLSKTFHTKPDLVVLEFSTPFTPSPVVAPACLPQKQIDTASSCYASGWGLQAPRKMDEFHPSSRSFRVFVHRNNTINYFLIF